MRALAGLFLLGVAPAPAGAAAVEPASFAPVAVAPGPWGRLEYTRILIEPPEDFVPAAATTPRPLRWTLRGAEAADPEALWQKAGLDAAQREALAGPARRTLAGDTLVLHPDPAAVAALRPEARAIIYTALATQPENPAQNDPFRVRSDALNEWFDQSILPADVIAFTRTLLYPRNHSILFADADLVLPRIARSETRIDFIKNLSRKSTLLIHLRIDAGSEVDALAGYWGQGRRRKDVKPILQSLHRRPGGGTLDVAHLLPAFARSLLYTYPEPSTHAHAAARDCHWTSLNFFRLTPDDRFTDIDTVRETLVRDYAPVSGSSTLGDLIVFTEPGGRVVHSSVYIADDIVFTKNGATFSTPWQFSQLAPLVAFYTLHEPLELRRYRLRTL